MSDDITLLNLIKEDNEIALQKMYCLYWQKLFAFAYNHLHSRELSEEVVQDVFLTLWEQRHSVNITTSLPAYLFGVTRNKVFNEIRRDRTRRKYDEDFATFVSELYDNSNVEQQELNDLQNSVEATINGLPKQCQKVFRLSRQQYIPNPEIAKQLNISIKTVENYLTQALKHIRTSLGQILMW